jgi:hypothetical protein
MSVGQISASRRRLPSPLTAGILAVTFAVGLTVGIALPRLTPISSAGANDQGARSVPGVATNNMSDAAYAATWAAAADPVPGVATNNMSDAAYAAMYGR